MRDESVSVIWDFDSTIVDFRAKNLNVTRVIVRDVTGRDPDSVPALASADTYQAALARHSNWRGFYGNELGLAEAGIDDAGALWSGMQLEDHTETPVFAGVWETIERLAEIPQGIVSQNGRENIAKVLEGTGLARHFGAVVGYLEVGFERQKPDPTGFVQCLETLTNLAPGVVFTVGDHETDAACARNTARYLAEQAIDVRVVSIGAFWCERPGATWEHPPDYDAFDPLDVVSIIARESGAATTEKTGPRSTQ